MDFEVFCSLFLLLASVVSDSDFNCFFYLGNVLLKFAG